MRGQKWVGRSWTKPHEGSFQQFEINYPTCCPQPDLPYCADEILFIKARLFS
jgi:hypothetical protein